MQGMVEHRGVAGNQSQRKESQPAPLVTPCPVGTCSRERYLTPVSAVFITLCPTTRPRLRTDISWTAWRAVRRMPCAPYTNGTARVFTHSPTGCSLTRVTRKRWFPRRSLTSGALFVATTNQSVSACLKEIARSRARGLLLAREWPERARTPARQGPLITMIEEVV